MQVGSAVIYPVPKPKPRKKVRRGAPTGRPRTRLKNRTRMKQINRKRGGHAFPHNVDEFYRAWIRQWECVIGGAYRAALFVNTRGRFYEHRCFGRVQVCHVKSRGAGGPDHGNVVPMCAGAHEEQHRRGLRAFEKRYRCDLASAAASYWARYKVERGGWVDRGGPND